MAGAEIFKIKVIGKGGHGAAPHLAVDPVLAAAQIIICPARDCCPQCRPSSDCRGQCLHHPWWGDLQCNPACSGTDRHNSYFRTGSPGAGSSTLRRDRARGGGSDGVSGGNRFAAPDPGNGQSNGDLPAIVQAVARQLFPEADIDPANFVTMGSEDFAFILEKVPGCFFFIGSANPEKGLDAGHHHPKFDFDEVVLPRAAALMSAAVLHPFIKQIVSTTILLFFLLTLNPWIDLLYFRLFLSNSGLRFSGVIMESRKSLMIFPSPLPLSMDPVHRLPM